MDWLRLLSSPVVTIDLEIFGKYCGYLIVFVPLCSQTSQHLPIRLLQPHVSESPTLNYDFQTYDLTIRLSCILLTLLFSLSGPAMGGYSVFWQSSNAARNVAPRALTQADLGVKGTLQELKGTFSMTDGVATVRVDMIRGDIANPFKVVENWPPAIWCGYCWVE